jgi:uncharacterized membrane protein
LKRFSYALITVLMYSAAVQGQTCNVDRQTSDMQTIVVIVRELNQARDHYDLMERLLALRMGIERFELSNIRCGCRDSALMATEARRQVIIALGAEEREAFAAAISAALSSIRSSVTYLSSPECRRRFDLQ